VEARATRICRRRRALTALAVVAIALVTAPAARAATTGVVPNFPTLIPELTPPPPGTLSPGFDVCPGGETSCPDEVIDEMYRRWIPLDASCDHKAVFAMTYLRTTEEYRRTVRNDPAFFSDPPWVNHEDAVFADFYFRAADNWNAGNVSAVPQAWRIAFDATDSPNVTGIGDLLLGMSAHINRDLPYTLAAVGLRHPDDSSRKPDHDKVNAFLEHIADPLQIELAARYDQLFELTDAEPSPLDEEGVLAAVRTWRENAWRYAEALLAAPDEAARQLVSTQIENQAASYAGLIVASNTVPGYGAIRDARCAAYQAAHRTAGGAAARADGLYGPAQKQAKRCKRKRHRAGHRRHRCKRKHRR